jgi:hypothetical protein
MIEVLIYKIELKKLKFPSSLSYLFDSNPFLELVKRVNYFIKHMKKLKTISAKFLFLCMLLVIFSFTANAQLIIDSAGDWGTPGIWTLGNIADDITEDATIQNGTGTITVSNDYTVGDVSMNNNTWTINSTSTFNIGQSGTPKNLSASNTAVLNVDGDLIIWGDLTVSNNLILNVSGNLVIKGNADMNNTANINVTGTMTVNGNFTASNNLDFLVDGTVTIDGDFETGNNPTTSGSGTVVIEGDCTSDICGTGPLQVCTPGSLDVDVSSNADDSWEDGGSMKNGDAKVELGEDGGADRWAGFRFQSITIPRGANITSAYLEIESDSDVSGSGSSVTLYADDRSDPPNFTSQDITSRTVTSASNTWTFSDWTNGNRYQSPDISSIIQELVDDNSGLSNDEIAILLDATGSAKREGKTYESGSSNAANLVVVWNCATTLCETVTINRHIGFRVRNN